MISRAMIKKPLHKKLTLLPLILLTGCDVSMKTQPKYETYDPSNFWSDGTSARPLPAHTVARGDLKREQEIKTEPKVTEALLKRGQERFEQFCSPCHGLSGYGDGMIPQRGFPPPPSFHTDRLRNVTGDYFFGVITNGYGVMFSYAQRVEPADRWAIAAYIRALQMSQYATLALAPEAKEHLQ